MKKLRLDLDQLTVESFASTSDEVEAPGTVYAHFTRLFSGCEPSCEQNCPDTSYSGQHNCFCNCQA